MIHHVPIFNNSVNNRSMWGPRSSLNSANRSKIQKTAHKGICFARLRQIQLQQLFTGRVNWFEVTAGSCGSLIHSEWRGIICVQKVISYKEQNLSQCTGKQNYVIESEENSDYYYLSNRKMIEAVFSSRVSLLAFYFQESFTAHKMVLSLKRRIKPGGRGRL